MFEWRWRVSDPCLERADKAIIEGLKQKKGEYSQEAKDATSTSRTYLQKLIELEAVTINGIPIEGKQKLKEGDEVRILFPSPKELEILPEEGEIEILFEDSSIAVVNKPQGLVVHPTAWQTNNTLVNRLLFQIKDLSGIGGTIRPGIVHRLDKNTSGVMVIAKSDVAHQRLVEMFAVHDIVRQYWAICFGAPKWSEITVEGYMGRSQNDRKKMSFSQNKIDVIHPKVSRADYERLDIFENEGYGIASLIEATLHTGRTHQVRVQLTHLGHSLLGDPDYGKPSCKQHKWTALPKAAQELIEKFQGQALHARLLEFRHPMSNEELHFETAPPDLFQELLVILKNRSISP